MKVKYFLKKQEVVQTYASTKNELITISDLLILYKKNVIKDIKKVVKGNLQSMFDSGFDSEKEVMEHLFYLTEKEAS